MPLHSYAVLHKLTPSPHTYANLTEPLFHPRHAKLPSFTPHAYKSPQPHPLTPDMPTLTHRISPFSPIHRDPPTFTPQICKLRTEPHLFTTHRTSIAHPTHTETSNFHPTCQTLKLNLIKQFSPFCKTTDA